MVRVGLNLEHFISLTNSAVALCGTFRVDNMMSKCQYLTFKIEHLFCVINQIEYVFIHVKYCTTYVSFV
jgi:hypothetical protein